LGTKIAGIDDIKDINWSSDSIAEALEREEREIESNIPDRDRFMGERWAMWRYNVKLFSPKVDIIPGDVGGECHMMLRVFIGSKDSIDVRMFETLRHVTVECPDKNRLVILHFAEEPEIRSLYTETFKELKRLKGIRVFIKVRGKRAYEN
jgi:hypothetical protein